MYVLVPEDPVFMARFLTMEDPLFHSLNYFHLGELPSDQAELIHTAYNSWGALQGQLPAYFHQEEQHPNGAGHSHIPAGCTLHSPSGKPLAGLYAVEMSASALSDLVACHELLALAALHDSGALGSALRDVAVEDPRQDPVENFRRALSVLRLQAPPRLLEKLRHAALAGPAAEITLDAAQEAEWIAFYAQIVHTLSEGDTFAYAMHQALYS